MKKGDGMRFILYIVLVYVVKKITFVLTQEFVCICIFIINANQHAELAFLLKYKICSTGNMI